MATTRNARNAIFGSGAAAISGLIVGEGEPHVVLFKTFAAAGQSAGVPIPSGVSSAIVQTAAAGAPTTATVQAEGSVDGVNWYALSAPSVQASTVQKFTQCRLNCTGLSGGTSPTLTVCAVINP